MTSTGIRNGIIGAAAVMSLLIGFIAYRFHVEAHRLRDIDGLLSEVSCHAQSYPPQFDSPVQRTHIETQLREALKRIELGLEDYAYDPELLFRAGFAYGMAYHLDFPAADSKSQWAYMRLLKLKPKDARANYCYGALLAGTTRRRAECFRYLQRAADLGRAEAHYTMAVAYASQGDQSNALREVDIYLTKDPNDPAARKLRELLVAADSSETATTASGKQN